MRALQSPTLQPQTPLLFPPPKITATTLSSFPPPGTMGAPAFPQPSVTQHHKPAPDPLPIIPPSSTDAKQDSNTNETITNEPAASQEPTSQEPTSQESTSQESTSQDSTSQDSTSQDPTSQDSISQDPTSQDPTSQEPEVLSLQPAKDDTVAVPETTQEEVKEEERVQEAADKQPEPAASASSEDKEQISNSNDIPDVAAPADDIAMDTSNPMPSGEVESTTGAHLDEPPVDVQPVEPREDEIKNTLPPIEATINTEQPIADSSSVTDLGSSAVSDGVTPPQPSTTTGNDASEGAATTEGMVQQEATAEGESAGGGGESSANEGKEEPQVEEAMECAETGGENKETSPQMEQ